MATNSADPELMDSMANALDGYASSVETWGRASGTVLQAHQYHYAATSVAGTTYGAASWARSWAASLRSRASLLSAHETIALAGAGSAGGAGAALGAGRIWAFGETTPLSFQDWYAARMAELAATAEARQLAAALATALDATDYESVWTIVHRLAEINDRSVATAFFNGLGAAGIGKLPNDLVGMTSYGEVYLRGTVGHPADLISMLSRQLAGASLTRGLAFTGADVIRADLDVDVLDQRYFTGYGAEYLFIANGFETTFLTGAAAAFVPYADFPISAQQILVSGLDGQLPVDAREFLLPDVAAAGGGAELVLLLLDNDDLHALFNPYAYLQENGANALGPILEQATIELFEKDPLQAEYIVGALINYAAEAPLHGTADIFASALTLVLPKVAGVVNDETASAYFGDPAAREVLVTESSLVAALAGLAASEAATAALFEGLADHYGGLMVAAGGDPRALNRIAISLAEVSAVMTTAIQEAGIGDAADRDERTAALIGLIDSVSSLVPLPGAGTVGALGGKIIKVTYSDLVDRGTALLETGYEGEARRDTDVMIDALLYSYTELLTLSYLQSQGGVAASVDEFFTANPQLDRSLYDFSNGGGGIAANLDDRQAQAYGQWVSFASGDPAVSAAISRMLAEFLAGLPHYDG